MISSGFVWFVVDSVSVCDPEESCCCCMSGLRLSGVAMLGKWRSRLCFIGVGMPRVSRVLLTHRCIVAGFQTCPWNQVNVRVVSLCYR